MSKDAVYEKTDFQDLPQIMTISWWASIIKLAGQNQITISMHCRNY